MQKISGIEISKEIIGRLKKLPKPSKAMAAVLVGDNPISANFVSEKEKVAKELGLGFKIYNLSDKLNNNDLRSEVNKIAADPAVGGVIVQLPLPPHIEKHEVLRDIPIAKDVDVLGSGAIASFYVRESGVLPPSVGVIEEIVSKFSLDLSKMRVAIVGMGLLVGKPIALYLMHRAKSVNLLDQKSDIKDIHAAEMVISGVGKAKLIMPKMLQRGAVVIDFGYDYSEGKLVGDFDHAVDDSDEQKLHHIKIYTPTPGGTGPILVAKLFENFYKLNSK